MLARLRSLWRNLGHRDRVDRDLDNEVRAVFDILVDEKMRDRPVARTGAPRRDARAGRVEARSSSRSAKRAPARRSTRC